MHVLVSGRKIITTTDASAAKAQEVLAEILGVVGGTGGGKPQLARGYLAPTASYDALQKWLLSLSPHHSP